MGGERERGRRLLDSLLNRWVWCQRGGLRDVRIEDAADASTNTQSKLTKPRAEQQNGGRQRDSSAGKSLEGDDGPRGGP
eukprot:358131-Chlamydomonas_euryale.AAC.4